MTPPEPIAPEPTDRAPLDPAEARRIEAAYGARVLPGVTVARYAAGAGVTWQPVPLREQSHAAARKYHRAQRLARAHRWVPGQADDRTPQDRSAR